MGIALESGAYQLQPPYCSGASITPSARTKLRPLVLPNLKTIHHLHLRSGITGEIHHRSWASRSHPPIAAKKKKMEDLKMWQCRHCEMIGPAQLHMFHDTYCGEMSNRSKNHQVVSDSTRKKYIQGGWVEKREKCIEILKISFAKEEMAQKEDRGTVEKLNVIPNREGGRL
ncbi:uncharacterized protein LOC117171858 [Belonocnema kinseyi]|uniref:uncharacterized protein LOC117171858 n=1 Tax=Belonocnema kinseyi TaxID=2817044 RepID=UPI00143DAD30|nr:uncharacterized protein LOC117171858 [Belonocnema kinseyi]